MIYDILTFYLENGLNVVFHKIHYVKTVSCGIWINQGSKHESEELNGISHLIEHLKMNGENDLNNELREIINNLSLNGVVYNATTTKEFTSYYFTGLSNTFTDCIKALANMSMHNVKFSNSMFENEKQVVLEEANSFYSSFNQIQERTGQALWGNQDVGRIILGSKENIKSFKISDVEEAIEASYTPENSSIVIVGNVEYETVVDVVNEYFSKWEDKSTREYVETVNKYPDIFLSNTKGNSTALSIGFKVPSFLDTNKHYVESLANILGNPASHSRLCKEIRINRGLAYNLGAFVNLYQNRGTLGFTVVCSNTNVEEVIKIIMNEINTIKTDEITFEEMNRAQKVMETTTLLQLDNVNAQLKFLGKCAAYGSIFSLEQEIRMVKKLDRSKISNIANNIFKNENMTLALIGDCDIDRLIRLIKLEN